MELLNHSLICQRYFFPRPGQPEDFRDFVSPDGVHLRCWEHRPHPEGRTLVHYHGNGEIICDYLPDFAHAIETMGLNLLLVEYRGYGGSGGAPELGKMLEDVATVRTQCGLRSDQTFVYGRSVGAIFAVEWAFQEPELAGLILESGVADPRQRLLLRLEPAELGVSSETFDAALAQHLDHRRKLARYRSPLLVLHAARDSLVGVEHAHLHLQWYQGQDSHQVLFPWGDHNDVLARNWPEYLAHLGAFTAGQRGAVPTRAAKTTRSSS